MEFSECFVSGEWRLGQLVWMDPEQRHLRRWRRFYQRPTVQQSNSSLQWSQLRRSCNGTQIRPSTSVSWVHLVISSGFPSIVVVICDCDWTFIWRRSKNKLKANHSRCLRLRLISCSSCQSFNTMQTNSYYHRCSHHHHHLTSSSPLSSSSSYIVIIV